jgi:N-acetylglucosamine-6-sulfatase
LRRRLRRLDEFGSLPRPAVLGVGLVVLLLAGVWGYGSPGGGAASPEDVAKPNVVLIVTDDQRHDTLSTMPTVRTELAAKGVTFPRAVVVNPLCCPSRVSILTGLYSHSSGFYAQNSFSPVVSKAFARIPNLGTWLTSRGYQTAFVGKYLNGYDGSFVPAGWSHWAPFTGLPGYYDYALLRPGGPVAYGRAPADYSTDVLADEADSFVRAADPDRRLFLFFAPYAPHVEITGTPPAAAPRHVGSVPVQPWQPPGVGEDLSDKPAWLRSFAASLPPMARHDPAEVRAGQLASLRAVDDAVRRILDALADTGRLQDTLILFTSDNGFTWGEHGLGNYKLTPYEESIRVPFIARYDGRLPAGAVDDRLVASIDIAPTVMQAAGATLRADGRSLLEAGPWRTDVLVEHTGTRVPTYCTVRSRSAMYTAYADGAEELYDLAADPYQLRNLVNGRLRREARHEMRARVRELCRPAPRGLVLPSVCTKSGGPRANLLHGTRWFDVICARAGNDRVLARDTRRDLVYCGSGRDSAFVDRVDVVKACETVLRR